MNASPTVESGSLVEFVYRMFDKDPDSLSPEPDPGLKAAGFEITYYLNANVIGKPKFFGFIAENRVRRQTAIAIRGTRGIEEWIIDFAAIPVRFKLHGEDHLDGFVAIGFLSVYRTMRAVAASGARSTFDEALMNTGSRLTARLIESNGETLIIAGHSLGGALATLGAAHLLFHFEELRKITSFYTFGSPRVGTPGFVGGFDRLAPHIVRVWNEFDIVPQLPLPPLYDHVGGDGRKIEQTSEQIEHLKGSFGCQHVMPNYLWLLDPSTTLGPDPKCIDDSDLISLINRIWARAKQRRRRGGFHVDVI